MSVKTSIQSITAIAIAAIATNAFGVATVTPTGSGVQAYFGSQSNAFTDSLPLVGPWGTPGFGTYPANAGLPGVPAQPPQGSYPSYPGVPFQGSGSVASFNDLAPGTANTNATSVISDFYNPTATNVADAGAFIPFWNMNQGSTAVGYTYQQLNFGAAYTLTSNSGLAGSTPSVPLFIFGTAATGGYVQFDGVVEYDFIPVNADGTLGGPPVPLGQLNYTFSTTGTSFATPIFSTGTISPIGATDGILELTGHFWLAGDPFTATIVPEPASIATLSLSCMMLMRRRKN